VPVPISEVGERLDEEVLSLVATEDSDADQVAADGPGWFEVLMRVIPFAG